MATGPQSNFEQISESQLYAKAEPVPDALSKPAISSTMMARSLGLLSIGLGLAEILAPRQLGRLIGVRRPNSWLIRLFGMREVASGIFIFVRGKRPARAVWSRVVGDALDLTAVGIAFASRRNKKRNLAFAAGNVAAVTALDVICATQLSR